MLSTRSPDPLGAQRHLADAQLDRLGTARESVEPDGVHAAHWVDGRWQAGYCCGNHRRSGYLDRVFQQGGNAQRDPTLCTGSG
jgi:hypothetical protein